MNECAPERRCAGTIVRRRAAAPWIAMAVLGAAVSGCVTFRTGPPHFAAPWPPSVTGPRPIVRLVVIGSAQTNAIPRDIGPILDLWGATTERAYRESALFADVALHPRRADLRIEVELHADVHQNAAVSAFSYLTLCVLPNVITTDIAMTTRASTDDGQPIGTYEVRGRTREVWQLLLLPFTPFFEPHTVSPEIVYDLNRETITELHARGVF